MNTSRFFARIARLTLAASVIAGGVIGVEVATAAPASAASCVTVSFSAGTYSGNVGGRKLYQSGELTVPNSPCKDINVRTLSGTANVQIWAAGGSISGGWTPIRSTWSVVLGGSNTYSLQGLRFRVVSLDRPVNGKVMF